MYNKPTALSLLTGERVKVSRKIRKRQECPLASLLFSVVLEVHGKAFSQEKETKVTQIGMEEVKLSLLTGNMILFIQKISLKYC